MTSALELSMTGAGYHPDVLQQQEQTPDMRRPSPGGSRSRVFTRKGGRRVRVWLVRIAVVAAAVLAWEIFGRRNEGIFVPAFTTTVEHLWKLGTDGRLIDAVWMSNQSVLIGFPVSAVLGGAIGVLFGRLRGIDRALGYYLDVMLVIPMIAVVPIVIVALGLTLTTRIFVVVLFTLPVIALNTRAALRIIDEPLVEMSRAFGGTRRQVWQTVVLPAALGPVFTGLRIGLARAVSGMIVVELILVPAGLGGLLVTFRSEFAAADLYAATLAILVEGLLLVGLAHGLENAFLRRLRGGADA